MRTLARAAAFTGIFAAMWCAVVPVEAGTIILTGAGAGSPCRGATAETCYAYDFGNVALGTCKPGKILHNLLSARLRIVTVKLWR